MGGEALVSDKYKFPLHITEQSPGMFAHFFLYLHVRVVITNWSTFTIRNPAFTNAEGTTTLIRKSTVDVLNDCIPILVIGPKIEFCFWLIHNSLFIV